jgi:hypothetical protein
MRRRRLPQHVIDRQGSTGRDERDERVASGEKGPSFAAGRSRASEPAPSGSGGDRRRVKTTEPSRAERGVTGRCYGETALERPEEP